MDYFTAVQKGKSRVKVSVETLQAIAGPCYPMLFLKTGLADWTPVGDEQLFSTLRRGDGTAALVICDADGNSKAVSAWFSEATASGYAAELRTRGLVEYIGVVKLPL
ncbi:MAG TPA: hypothetical protein VEJ36_00960 [Nitrososphaerales archaeon]|nr:hypothetical protein [Nitrososphaerales archaeon]